MHRSWAWADRPLADVISDYLISRPVHRHAKLIAVLSVLILVFGAQTNVSPATSAETSDVLVGQGDIDPVNDPATSTQATSTPATSTPATSTPATSTPATSTPATSEVALDGGVTRIAVKYRTPSRSSFVVSAVEAELGVAMSGDAPNAGRVQVLQFSTPISDAEGADLVAAFESRPDVLWAELPSRFYPADYPATPPNDPEYVTEQWPLWGPFGIGIGSGSSEMADSWSVATGEPVVVAVLDTGYLAHQDLPASQMVTGYDFVTNEAGGSRNRAYGDGTSAASVNMDGDYISTGIFGPVGPDAIPLDPGDWNTRNSVWHGTFIAGLVAASTNNGSTIAGAAPSARVQPVRVSSWKGADAFDLTDGIEWASGGSTFLGEAAPPLNATPAKVLNISLESTSIGACPSYLSEAITRAIGRGSIVVVAAGNDNAQASLRAPANCPGVISVAATGPDGKRASYSNYGAVSLSAPGGSSEVSGSGIMSLSNAGTTTPTVIDTDVSFGIGTSYAAPHVAAVAALLMSLDPTLDVGEVTSLLTTSVTPFPGGVCDPVRTCGSGIVSASSAIAALIPSVSLLNSLSLSSGSLTPSFDQTTYGYATFVNNDVSSIRVTATGQPGATLTVNGVSSTLGVASSPVVLSLGANSIPVVVTSADSTTTSSYAVEVTRAAPGPLTFSSGAFGGVTVGESAALTVTVSNTGNASATPTTITPAGAGVSVTGGTCAVSTPIAPAGSCTVFLSWSPVSAGALTGASLTLSYPGGVNGSDSVTLTGSANPVPIPSPSISGISPGSGSVLGGTRVTISGANLTGAFGVTVGGVAASSVVVVNSTTVQLTTPAGVQGPRDVFLSTLGGSASAVGGFTYVAEGGGGGGGGGGGAAPDSGGGGSPTPVVSTAPVISGISPGSGSVLGGTRVTISGANLTGASGVTFGGVPATNIVVVNSSTVQVTTPAGGEGRRDVVVSTPRGSVTSVGGFYYISDAEPVRFTVVSTQGGIERVVVSSGAAQASPMVSLSGAKSRAQSTAPTLRFQTNVVLAPEVTGLPKSKRWAVRMLVPGADNGTQRLFLGSVYSSKNGTAVLPAVRAVTKGLFTYRLRAKDERSYYLNIRIS